MLHPDPPTPPVRGRALHGGSCSPRRRRRGSDSAAPGWAGASCLSGDGAHGGSGVARRLRGSRAAAMFGCLVAGRLVSAARARAGPSTRSGAGWSCRRALGPPGPQAPAPRPHRRLPCRASLPGGACHPPGNVVSSETSWELKRSFLRLDCALAARMWHLG